MRIRVQLTIAVFLCVLIAIVPAPAQERSLGAIGVGDEDIRITEIIHGSPAETAGLAVGDILTTIDGEPSWTKMITGKFELTTSKNLGSRLLVSYLREGGQGTTTLIVRTWPQMTTSAPAKPTVNREQTTLFGYTLGQPEPESTCGSDACWEEVRGLGFNAVYLDTDTVGDKPDGKIGRILADWLPEVCERVEVALKDKFHSPTSISSWRGQNGLGLPITDNVSFGGRLAPFFFAIILARRKNGSVRSCITFARPQLRCVACRKSVRCARRISWVASC